MNVLRCKGEMTRQEICDASGLSPAATARITSALEGERLIERTTKVTSTGGRPAWRYRFTAEGRFLIGLRVRRNGCRGILLKVESVTGEEILEATKECARLLVQKGKELGMGPVSVGVSVPAPVDKEGFVSKGREIDWSGVAIREILEEVTGLPVHAENDANALVCSELYPGYAPDSLAALILDHGIGLGMLCNGTLVRGANSRAGEMQHFNAFMRAFTPEAEVDGGIPYFVSNLLAIDLQDEVAAPIRLWKRSVEPGDKWGRDLSQLLDILAAMIEATITLMDPERIVLGDFHPDHQERIISDIRSRLNHILPEPRLDISRKGADAVLFGAAMLASQLVDLQSI
ncbi:MAG: ROK family transcriptional regulator [Smithella sp.]|nr:ROK family transcriptional regulator [Smithella sp.]